MNSTMPILCYLKKKFSCTMEKHAYAQLDLEEPTHDMKRKVRRIFYL